jgi:arylformamidase
MRRFMMMIACLPTLAMAAPQTVAYGTDPAEQMDIYRPERPRGPVILMVHGGGWAHGDKAGRGVITNKMPHYRDAGIVFVSINYPMMPQANPLQQAQSVAKAVAYAQAHAHEWGGDARQLVLMGHSAGAHLVALIGAKPSMLAQNVAAVVALDSAAYHVETIMRMPHLGLYDRAFGEDVALWAASSPATQLEAGSPPFLLVCSSTRRVACRQAEAFAAQVQGRGGQAQVLPQALSHGEINDRLGLPGAYTAAVDAFLAAHAGTR